MTPTADHYARAIVAAARQTGENPESFVDEDPRARFRHYAFHALLNVFPDADRTVVAASLKCPGKPTYFYRTSIWHVLGQGPHRKEPIEWWDSGVLTLTIKALGVVPRAAPTEPPLSPSPANPVTPKAVPRQAVRQERQVETPKRQAAAHGPPRTGLDRFVDRFGRPADWNAGGDDQLQGRERERRACRDLLAEAAANTAKLQAKLPPEPDE